MLGVLILACLRCVLRYPNNFPTSRFYIYSHDIVKIGAQIERTEHEIVDNNRTPCLALNPSPRTPTGSTVGARKEPRENPKRAQREPRGARGEQREPAGSADRHRLRVIVSYIHCYAAYPQP